MNRGEIRWYTFRLPDKRRPVLILTRSEVIDRLNEIIVVPATRTIRGLPTEVVLTPEDGMPVACALNFDHVSTAQRERIGPLLCTFPQHAGLKRGLRYFALAVSARGSSCWNEGVGRWVYAARGVEFTRGVANMPWNWREFVVKYCDGRLLAFAANL